MPATRRSAVPLILPAGRSALWVHVPDDADAKRAVRCLADHQVLYLRHYGHGRQQDIHIR